MTTLFYKGVILELEGLTRPVGKKIMQDLLQTLRACLHEGGGPQVGEVTCGGLPHLTCKRDHIKMRDYMDRRATPPKRVTSPIWGTPPPCKQALRRNPLGN